MKQVVGVFVIFMVFGHVYTQFTFEIQQHFEFENSLKESQESFRAWRSEASRQKTLRIVDYNRTYTVELDLCLDPYYDEQNTTIFVNDIVYSNDGPSDTVYVRINKENIGNFTTLERWRNGYKWNVFRNSGRIGPSLTLPKGVHTLEIEVETDKWGVELDRIEINAENQNPLSNMFCNATLYAKT